VTPPSRAVVPPGSVLRSRSLWPPARGRVCRALRAGPTPAQLCACPPPPTGWMPKSGCGRSPPPLTLTDRQPPGGVQLHGLNPETRSWLVAS
jgi:hypothetical protein